MASKEELNTEEMFEFGLISRSIVTAFESRGYGLYLVSTRGGNVLFSEPSQVEEFIVMGREKLILDLGYRYILLPLVEQDKDPRAVFQAIHKMVQEMRAAYFFNIIEGKEGKPEVESRHVVDSVVIVPPYLELTIDPRFSNPCGNTIELPLGIAAQTIRRQMLLALRGPRVEVPSKLLQKGGL